jgi:4-hydroxy-4-methyl-2-oxoglutarate aldolase
MNPVQALVAYDTPTIANAMESLQIAERRFTGPQIRPIVTAGRPIVGVAVTATMKQQWGGKFAHLPPWLEFLEAIERSPLPVVALFHDESERAGRDAMIGEGMSRAMRAAGAVGVLCDGVVRDVGALREMGWPVWGTGVAADRGRIRFHRCQVPVEIAGMPVSPGEIVHADENGALIVPVDRIEEILEAAAKVAAKEADLFRMLSAPGFRVSQLREFYAGPLASAHGEH